MPSTSSIAAPGIRPPSALRRVSRAQGPIKPVWKADLRELWWNNLLIKKFNQPAKNQELIIVAFQEQKWSTSIDDPLPGGSDSKRLRDTVKALNEYHQNPDILHFRMDGTGEGVIWELLRSAP